MIIGHEVSCIMDKCFDEVDGFEANLACAIAKKAHDKNKLDKDIHILRGRVAEYLDGQRVDQLMQSVNNETCSTVLKACLIEAWLKKAGDPAAVTIPWLRCGTPMGIDTDFEELDGIWPPQDKNESQPNLQLDPDEWIEVVDMRIPDEDLINMMKEFEAKGYIKCYRDRASLEKDAGGNAVFSKMLIIKKRHVARPPMTIRSRCVSSLT